MRVLNIATWVISGASIYILLSVCSITLGGGGEIDAHVELEKGDNVSMLQIEMADFEKEGRLIRVNVDRLSSVKIVWSKPVLVNVKAFRVLSVMGQEGRVGDPLEPIDNGEVINVKGSTIDIYFTFSVIGRPAGGDVESSRVLVGLQSEDKSSTLDFDVKVYNIGDPPDSYLIQANINPYVTSFSLIHLREIYRMLGEHGVNSIVLPLALTTGKVGELTDVLNFLFSDLGFKMARVSIPSTFTWRYAGSVDISEKVSSVCQYLDEVYSNAKIYADQGKLSVKLWDEPEARNYKELRELYYGVRKCHPEFLLEVSGTLRDISIESFSDVWVAHEKVISQESVDAAKRKGLTVLGYFNSLHRLTLPRVSPRGLGWLMYINGLDGYHFWNVASWRSSPITNHVGKENDFGDGTFLYQGSDKNEILQSLRLKEFREGLEDLDILDIARYRVNQMPEGVIQTILSCVGYGSCSSAQYNNAHSVLLREALKSRPPLSPM